VRFTLRAVTPCLIASLGALVMAVPAGAAPKPITGKLSEPGYTVIAVAASGRATLVQANGGEFSVRPPARRATLHLRAANGKYAGPIVVGRARRHALVGVKDGARLGAVNVLRGYAEVRSKLPNRWVDARRKARTRRGAPLGARAFGRVRARRPRRASPRDRDLDGVPNVLDIDDDGDLILDSLDRSSAARRAATADDFGGFTVGVSGELNHALNANAAGVTPDQIDALLSTHGGFNFFEAFPRNSSVELDCGTDNPETPEREGLVYCSSGVPPSTGRELPPVGAPLAPRDGWRRFPDDFDADGDGFGAVSGPGALRSAVLVHGARSSQIGTADVLTLRFADGDTISTTLQYVAVTTPAVASYNDGQGHSRNVSYPVPGPDPETGMGSGQPCETGTNCSGPGTRGNPFPVRARETACSDRAFCDPGDVVLRLSFWRPQRARLPGDPEPGPGDSDTWTDIGGLSYGVSAGPSLDCWPEDFSSNDPNLVFYEGEGREPGAEPGDDAGIFDRPPAPPDKPANPENTFTYTLNLSRCLGRPQEGVPTSTFDVGETTAVEFLSGNRTSGARGGAALTVFFKRVP
jgi:hypothetical protein